MELEHARGKCRSLEGGTEARSSTILCSVQREAEAGRGVLEAVERQSLVSLEVIQAQRIQQKEGSSNGEAKSIEDKKTAVVDGSQENVEEVETKKDI